MSLRVAVALGGVLLVAAGAAAQPRAGGGVRLVEAAELAPATVVASVSQVERLDRHGYSALLRVERSLRGPIGRGVEVRIGWEELATSRAARFEDGERLLLSLERLPGASIWRQRLPDPDVRASALTVAMRGDAFLRRPSARSLDRLEHYLALTAADREAAFGVGYLLDLVSAAEPPLATDALRRLALRADLDAKLADRGGERLVRAMLRTDAGEPFAQAIAELIGERRLETTRASLEALAAGDPVPPALVFEALARLDEGLSAQRSAALLEAGSAEHREVAVRFAGGPDAGAALSRLLVDDPDPAVRAAATRRLVELEGSGALDALLPALGDPAPAVRSVAVAEFGGLGAPAVPALRRTVDGNDAVAAQTAVVALGLCGAPEARAALEEIAASHSDAGLRELAGVALGRPLGHRH